MIWRGSSIILPTTPSLPANGSIERIVQLASFPFIGGPCLEYPAARQLVHGNYIVYYTVSRREVVIRAVVHGAREFRK